MRWVPEVSAREGTAEALTRAQGAAAAVVIIPDSESNISYAMAALGATELPGVLPFTAPQAAAAGDVPTTHRRQDPDTLRALLDESRRILDAAGVPGFRVWPNPSYRRGAPDKLPDGSPNPASMEFRFPKAWQTFCKAEDVPPHYRLDRWKPGDGVLMCAGLGLDGVDVDTKHGAVVEDQRQRLDGVGVNILGTVRTPSGGAHFYVPTSGICSSAHTVNGVDYRGRGRDRTGAGLLHMPGSSRPLYDGAGYEWAEPLDPADLDDLGAMLDESSDTVGSYLWGLGIEPRSHAAGQVIATVGATPYDVRLMPRWLWELVADLGPEWEVAGGERSRDRSKRFHHLVKACQRARLAQGQAVTVIAPWCDAVGKYAGRVADEVARSWGKGDAAEDRKRSLPETGAAVEDVPGTSPEPEPWDEPMPLGGGTPAPVPLDGLPGFLRRMVEAVAEQSQAPREVVLAAALGTLAAATRGVWDVHVRGGWNAGPSVLWVTALAASGERKGAGTKPLTAPLIDAERHLASEMRRANRNRETERKGLEASLKTADADADPTGWQRLAERIHEARPRAVPGLVISDATTEALGQYMTGQGGACAIFGTEASSFQTVAGRYSDAGGNFSLLNNAYDGEPVADLRIKRDGVRVERPALTWSVAVQPDVLAGYADAQSEGSGFLARFLLLVPASNVGKLNYRSEPVPEHVAAEWARVVEGLHAEAWRRYEAMTESLPDDLGPPSSVTFTDDAAELVLQYGERLDREAGDGGAVAYLGGWASKAPARIARLAAVLALAEDPYRRDVQESHAAAALTIADALTAHAGAAFGILRQAARLDPAARLVEALRKLGEPLVTTRDVWQAVRRQTSWVDSTDDVRRALDGAEDLGYVRRLPRPSGSSAGRPSERWEVHPSITR